MKRGRCMSRITYLAWGFLPGVVTYQITLVRAHSGDLRRSLGAVGARFVLIFG